MKKCNADDHPYCTYRVDTGELVCAAGHRQKNALVEAKDHSSRLTSYAQLTGNLPEASATRALHLHFSGYDPRASGGRQMIKLELHGSLPEEVAQINVQLSSELISTGVMLQRFERSLSGQWRPILISFSSKNKEYGQYQLEVELNQMRAGFSAELCTELGVKPAPRRWTCSTIILVPPPETSLTEIHRVFLGAQKNVKVLADDGSIAKLSGLNSYAHDNINLEISAKNAALTQVELSAPTGKYEIALGSIAWDEELLEESPAIASAIASPITSRAVSEIKQHLEIKNNASLISRHPQAPSQIRLLALDHWVIGRLDLHRPSADILLAHQGKSSAENAQLTRRISASHAIIRRTDLGAELIDISRYGTLLDGLALKKDTATPLKAGMHIELCASIKGIACLKVIAILSHAIILQRIDSDRALANAEIFYLLTPETKPSTPSQYLPTGLPLLFHYAGSFWHSDSQTKQETSLDPGTALDKVLGTPNGSRFSNDAYEETNVRGFGLWRHVASATPAVSATALLSKKQ